MCVCLGGGGWWKGVFVGGWEWRTTQNNRYGASAQLSLINASQDFIQVGWIVCVDVDDGGWLVLEGGGGWGGGDGGLCRTVATTPLLSSASSVLLRISYRWGGFEYVDDGGWLVLGGGEGGGGAMEDCLEQLWQHLCPAQPHLNASQDFIQVGWIYVCVLQYNLVCVCVLRGGGGSG